uniref:Heat shock protein 70 n=1 Tax=Panagrolaimus davidi TaxID=227884 RepID=A0A914Q8K9_9BILA
MLKIGEVLFVFKIDENGIFSYDFTVIEALESRQRRVKNFYANQKKLDTIYNIPEKDFINSLNINAVGIDLGMTRSCVGVNRTNGIELVAIDNNERQLPSYVSFKEKDPICGQLVINNLHSYANSTVFDIKRIIGRNFNEIQINSAWPFEVIKNDMDKPLLRVQSSEKNKLKVIANNGDSNLGGSDFDMVLVQHFEKILETRYKIIMNEKNRYRLIQKCLDIKHTLSTESEASEINFEIDEFLTVTRQEFEQMASKLLDQIGDVLKQTFSKTDIFACDINKVLFVGGGCRMPMIQHFLRKRFPKAEHSCDENPDGMVAIGAAFYSSFLMSKNDSSNCNIT